MGEMTGRVALVTGAASGIGLASAEALARHGADVALLSLPDDDLASAAQRVGAHGGSVLTVGVDVSDSAAVRGAFDRVEAELGPIDAVHNNAGISIVSPLADTSDEVFRRLVDVNLAGSFFVLREAARVMQTRRRGAVVNTGSELAVIGQAGYVAYTATKGAIVAMTRSAAAELASWGIRVNAVCPGTVATPLVDHVASIFPPDLDPRVMDRLLMMLPGPAISPAEIAQSIVYLASPAARMITGCVLAFDGGMS
jgi:NAD(P)-dependent dehydrogenase (short-subunit alcohol dehydrogenase family)